MTRDTGSALAEFVLVGSMLTMLFLALLQLGIDFHVRNVLAACAGDGARFAANADVKTGVAAGVATERCIRSTAGFASSVTVRPRMEMVNGVAEVVVAVDARLPTWFGLLPALPVRAVGRAVLEPR